MKRLMLALLLLAFAMPVAAQDEPPGDEPGPIFFGARQLVIEFLELDPAQIAAWDLLWEDHRIAEQPVQQQIADVQAAIEDLFAGGNPDPTELGLLMIERRALGEQLRDIHVTYIEGFELVLDEEQFGRLHDLRLAERIQRFIPAFKAFELVRR